MLHSACWKFLKFGLTLRTKQGLTLGQEVQLSYFESRKTPSREKGFAFVSKVIHLGVEEQKAPVLLSQS